MDHFWRKGGPFPARQRAVSGSGEGRFRRGRGQFLAKSISSCLQKTTLNTVSVGYAAYVLCIPSHLKRINTLLKNFWIQSIL